MRCALSKFIIYKFIRYYKLLRWSENICVSSFPDAKNAMKESKTTLTDAGTPAEGSHGNPSRASPQAAQGDRQSARQALTQVCQTLF